MTKQWYNPKVIQKPFTRYNPSLHENIASAYRPWFVVLSVLLVFVGGALIVCSVFLKSIDPNIKDEIFHMWVAVPLVASGIFAFACRITKKKKNVAAFLVFIITVALLCSGGALIGGVHFLMDRWKQVKRELNSNHCTTNKKENICLCINVPRISMPAFMDSCDALERMVNLIIAELGLSVVGFIASVMSVYLAFMSICCAPWVYTEWYEEQYDPDFTEQLPPVSIRPIKPLVWESNYSNAAYIGPYEDDQ